MSNGSKTDEVKSLLLGALELEGAERKEYLDAECGEDEGLRQRVSRLLRAHDGAPGFLGTPLEEPSGNEKEDRGDEEPGTIIGRYKLLQQIGEGGFGRVWMAEQQEPVRRKVALKIIKLGMDTRQVVARFEAERQALALMDHPNIAKVLDGGATEKGRPFFVMELVRGVPITEYCDVAKLSTRERLGLFIDVCHAVQHAHQKGIIHRDLKPSNVMVTLHDGRPVPMVIDFGIAKATTGNLTEKTLFTEFHQFIGTPQYMSPEQAEISGLDVDTRADIYSLGVLLYELLTGTTPVDPVTLREAGYQEILRVIREEEPPRPSNRVSTMGELRVTVASARATEPDLLRRLMAGDLDWIVMKALEKERTRRYETAAGLAIDIQRHLTDEPVRARPPSRTYRLRKFVRRNRVGVLAGSVVVLTLIAGTAAATVGFVRASQGRKEALSAETVAREAERTALEEAKKAREAEEDARDQRELALASAREARQEAAASVAINEFYDRMLGSIDPLRLRQSSGFAQDPGAVQVTAAGMARDVSVSEMLSDAAATVEASFAGKPELEAQVRETIGVTLLGLGVPSEAERELEAALRLHVDRSGAEHTDTLRLKLLLGATASEAGDAGRAVEIVREALAGMERVHGPEDPRTLHAATLLGEVLAQDGGYTEAEALLLKTLDAQRRVVGTEHRSTVDTLDTLTNLYLWQTAPLEAKPHAEEAVAISERILDADDVVRVQAELGLGLTSAFLMEFERGEELLRPVLHKLQRIAGEHHKTTTHAAFHLARCLRDEGDREERERLLRQGVVGYERVGEHSTSLFVARNDLAMMLFQRGAFTEAIELARANVESRKKVDGLRSPRTREAVSFLRDGLRLAGRVEEAGSVYRELVQFNVDTLGRDSPRTCSALGDLSLFLRSCGRLEEARDAWREIIALRRRISERPDADAWDFLQYGGTMLHPWVPGIRDVEGALEAFEQALEAGGDHDPELLRDLALAHHLLGEEEETAGWAARLIECSADEASAGSGTALLFHAELLLDCIVPAFRDPEAAMSFALQAVELMELPDAAAVRLFGHACALAGHREEALDASAWVLELLAAQIADPEVGEGRINSYVWILATTEFEELRDDEALAAGADRLAAFARRDHDHLHTLGVARYRLGEYREALALLTESDEWNRRAGEEYKPAMESIPRALCHLRLGDEERGRELLEGCAVQLDDPDLNFDDEMVLRGLLREAEALLQ